jgi:DNA-binding NarL/FixJ family response regulator
MYINLHHPKSTNVALVEDNPDFRATLESILNEASDCHCVCACDSAEEALKLIPQLLPDVVLMDLHLPNMSGVDCTRQLKNLCPSVQILILTVYEDNKHIFGALKAGASGYLLQRADPADILLAIEDVKQGGSPMSSQIARRVVQSFREPTSEPLKGERLSQREEEILQQLCKGCSTKEIAAHFFVSVNTVKTHLKRINEKLHVRSRTEAVLKFLRKRA